MATRQGLLQVFNPLIQARRFRGKINIQKPKPPHFERALYIALTKPWFINPNKDKKPLELCRKSQNRLSNNIDNPFQRIIASELNRWFHESRLVAFYHMNPMNADEQYKAYVLFHRQKMHYKNYGKKTMEWAIKGTKYEAVLDFYVSQNMTVFSPEPNVKQLLKVTKKFPQLVLLAAIYEGKLIDKDQLIELNQIPNLQSAQAGLVQVLNSAATTLTGQLNTHQNTLVSQLQERVKQLEVDDK